MKDWLRRQSQRGRAYATGPRQKALAAALIAFGLLILTWWQAGLWYRAWLLAGQRNQAMIDLTQYGNVLTLTLNQHFELLQELRNFVENRKTVLAGQALENEIDAFAAGLYAGTTDIRYVAVAPGGIQRYVYPLAGNETVPGRDLLRDSRPSVRAAVERAIESGGITLSQPGEFGRQDLYLTAWLAVYGADGWWGLVTMALDVAPLLDDAGLSMQPADLNLALRDHSGHLFYGHSAVFSANPLIYRIELPEGSWELAGVPVLGWDGAIYKTLRLFQGAGLTIVVLLVGLVYLVVNRQARLELAVDQRTREISNINQVLEHDIMQRKQVEHALRETQRALSTLMSNLPGMAYRSLNDSRRTMEFVSEGCLSLTGCEPADLIQNGRVAYMQLVHPEDRQPVWREIQAAVQSGNPFQITYRITTAGGEERWVWEQGRGVYGDEGELLALEGFITDTTERVQAYQMLEQRVIDRTRELSALYEVTAVASKSLSLATTLERSLEQVLTVMGSEAGAIHLSNEDQNILSLAVSRGLPAEVMARIGVLQPGRGLAGWVIEHGEPLVVSNLAGDPRAAEALLATGSQAYIGAPMRARGRVLGVLSVVAEGGRQFEIEEVALLASIADEIGVAVENAQLYEAEQMRRSQANTLLQVASVVGSTLELDEVLARILDQLRRVVNYDSASVQLLQEDNLQVIAARGFKDVQQVVGATFSLTEAPNHKVVANKTPVNLADAPALYPAFRQQPFSHIRSWLGVPLQVHERIIGIITVEREQPGGYNEEEISLTTAFADQAALALENARLYQQAEQLAIMEERSRLGRELHDSVTQSLYSLTLFAEVGRRAAESGNTEQVLDYLGRLGQVAQQTLKEMRLLVYELRTSALETEGLFRALQQRLDAVEKRAGVEVRLLGDTDIELPVVIEEGLYRIAQEALNNALKHAMASRVTIRINLDGDRVKLEVADNGRAFDVASVEGGGGMGLRNMRERAERLNGSLNIVSRHGEGTTISATVPLRQSWSRPVLPVDRLSEVPQ